MGMAAEFDLAAAEDSKTPYLRQLLQAGELGADLWTTAEAQTSA